MTKTIILDSSVVAKWFFPEEGNENALLFKEKFTRNEISLAAPVLLYYEMNNILRTAVNTYRVNIAEATKVFEAFLHLNFVVYSTEYLMKKTLQEALEYNISSYDASYVALSQYLHAPFITADKKLLRKVNSPLIADLEKFVL
ncbi:MAG: type II toxin-antitoxin system VapC family toxin [Candidatus Levyibacteriota bacterium]